VAHKAAFLEQKGGKNIICVQFTSTLEVKTVRVNLKQTEEASSPAEVLMWDEIHPGRMRGNTAMDINCL